MDIQTLTTFEESRLSQFSKQAISNVGIAAILYGGQRGFEPTTGKGSAKGLYLDQVDKPDNSHIHIVKDLCTPDDCQKLGGPAFGALCRLNIQQVKEIKQLLDEGNIDEAKNLLWDVYMVN